MISGMKPGWQTTEFWMTIATNLWAAFESGLPPLVRVIVPAAATAVYTVTRAITKAKAIPRTGPGSPEAVTRMLTG